MLKQPWNLVFLTGFLIYVVLRAVFIERTKRNEKAHSRVDARERALMFLVFLGSLALPLVYIFTPLLSFADYRLPGFAPWCGVVVMVVALWLFWRSHADLGLNWSQTLEVRKGHKVVKTGVYGSIRHPMYAAILLFTLAQGLLLENWLAGWSGLVTFAILVSIRMPREEAMMSEFFGQEYRDYMRQTGRLLPRIGGSPAER